MSNYPESEKMLAIQDKSQSIGEFMEWLQSKYTICEYDAHMSSYSLYTPARLDIEKELAEYFGIDLEIVEREKSQMLKEMRVENGS